MIFIEINGMRYSPVYCSARKMIQCLSFVPEYKSDAPTFFRYDEQKKVILFPTPLHPEKMVIYKLLDLTAQKNKYRQKGLPIKRPISKIK